MLIRIDFLLLSTDIINWKSADIKFITSYDSFTCHYGSLVMSNLQKFNSSDLCADQCSR
jgi:hypothetical protein